MKRAICLSFLTAGAVLTINAQTPAKPSPQTVSGCVAAIPKVPGKYVLATADRCMLISGTYDPAKIADREITVKGLVMESDEKSPLTVVIQSVQTAGASCTRTCVLEPPGTRGIHGRERPGSEGGTAGFSKTPGSGPQN